MKVLKFSDRRCEEVLGGVGDRLIRCNGEALARVKHEGRSEGPYDMCAAHADHNVRNRGAVVLAVDESLADLVTTRVWRSGNRRWKVVGWYSPEPTNEHRTPVSRVAYVEAASLEEALELGEKKIGERYAVDHGGLQLLNWYAREAPSHV